MNNLLFGFPAAYAPPPVQTVAEHAESTLYLPARISGISGLINLDFTPYLRFPLECFVDPAITYIYMGTGTQVAKTTFLICILNNIIDYRPATTMIQYSSKDQARTVSKGRLIPIFEASPSLSGHLTGVVDDLNRLEYKLDRMDVYFAWDSMRSVSGHPCKYVIKDEIKDVDSEINSAADDRTKSFAGRKIIEASSLLHPKDNITSALGLRRDRASEEEHAIDEEINLVQIPVRRFKAGGYTSLYFYYVPCPHCSEFQQLYPDRLRWPRDCAIRELTWKGFYRCMNCEKKIKNHHKREMIQAGEWRTENPGSNAVGFHLNSLYSLLGDACGFGEIAARYLRTYRSPERLKTTHNGYFAWPWDETEEGAPAVRITMPDEADEKNIFRRNSLPPGVKLITGGADVHKKTLHYQVWGWDDEKTIGEGWLLSWDIIDVDMELDPAYPLEVLENIRGTPFISDKRRLGILGFGVDSGYKTSDVYQWANAHDWLLPMKGQRGEIAVPEGQQQWHAVTPKPIERTPSGQYLKDSIRLYHPNTGYIKRQFYDDVAAGNYHFPIDVDQMVLDQMSSETLVERQKGGRVKRYYVKKVIDDEAGNPTSYQNHQLDCYVYARMMLEILLSNAKQHGGYSTYTDAASLYYRRKKKQRKKADSVGVK